MKTLTEPTGDAQVVATYNRSMRAADRLSLETNSLYAMCLLRLNNVVQPSDYAALKAAIEAIPGVQEIRLVVDHRTRDTLPVDHELWAVTEIMLRIDPLPEEQTP